VFIRFQKVGGELYAANGLSLDIKTYWKDNNTIVIKTKKDYVAVRKCKQVQSFQDIIKVEYIES
jgi:uncharacterized protein (DUF1330 family)